MLFSRLSDVAVALRDQQLDAWLIYDFRGINPLAEPLLGLPPEALATRRLAAAFTAEGRVRVLEHAIETNAIPDASATNVEKRIYLSKESFQDGIAWLLEGCDRVASEYCPRGENPYLSYLDAGTVELIRECTNELVSSGDLIQLFQAVISEEQWQSHLEAEQITTAAFPLVWAFIRDEISAHGGVEETAIERLILDHFKKHSLLPGHPPIVARAENAGLPHYETGCGVNTMIREGDLILVDLWGRLDRPGTVYSDLTRMGFAGSTPVQQHAEAFDVIVRARDTAIELLRDRFSSGEGPQGFEVDRACRDVVDAAGQGAYFTHRTGHSITTELHGSGAHMDDLETRETRRVLSGTGFSIEPGIYRPRPEDGGFGVRTEVNVFIRPDDEVRVTGGPLQTEIECLL